MAKRVSAEDYEQAVMAAAAARASAPELEPPEDYQMSPEFQTWLVEKMRAEVMGNSDPLGGALVGLKKNESGDNQQD